MFFIKEKINNIFDIEMLKHEIKIKLQELDSE